eukprot:CAMPEP_0198734132 /NCGR_PEP_ID=MMETSP1475-20131203/50630_1 /TAXON_ID= ORGANISM="Unidentified sp., Strain CCMP1999" /NCGR_SAMPLE_ID=MMETSP1475 /ASSEMBLY_ACC=CAM_ASM_001111 /LENGTH=555 /DNA_ID=CAMNT_0044497545 /DNA_START=38 /DNA_END=1705 /DNA_ORIENTATION=+
MTSRKCYYEVLNVSRDATDDELKRAYRKLALSLHPDKNPDDEEATAQFQLLQQSYDVLSDPHERAWYDAHREQILRGEDADGDEPAASAATNINIYEYFSASAYRGYNDDEKGFYTIFRHLFESIDDEERERTEFSRKGGNEELAPGFGDSSSEWKDVRLFYAFWENFSSERNFGFAEQWNLSEAPSRDIRRAMERENKRARAKAKKEFNETIRSLVAFVKKRDVRVQRRREEVLAEEERQKAAREEAKADKERRNRKLQEEMKSQQNDNLSYLDETIEEFYADDLQEKQATEEYYCTACKKRFRSKSQWTNHEKSKKHREKVEALKEDLMIDNEDLEVMQTQNELVEEVSKMSVAGDTNPYPVAEEGLQGVEEPENGHKEDVSQDPTVDQDFTADQDDPEGTDKRSTDTQRSDDDDYGIRASMFKAASKKKKKAQARMRRQAEKFVVEEDSAGAFPGGEESDGQDRGNTSQQKATGKDDEEITIISTGGDPLNGEGDRAAEADSSCNVCHQPFQSRNKLFQHIKETGHALKVETNQNEAVSRSKGKGRKKKGKR